MRMFGSKGRCKCKNSQKCKKGDACYYKKAMAALDRAHDIRKFEIELLWKRAGYVGTFQGLLFAALGVSFSFAYTEPIISTFGLIVCIVGIFLSFFWYLINSGSKFWHENWEKHIDFLEGEFEGKLHKTVLHKEGRQIHSVSRANISISKVFFTTWWILLIIIVTFDFFKLFNVDDSYILWTKIGLAALATIVTVCFLRRYYKKLKTESSKARKICWIKRKRPKHIDESKLVG